MKLEIGGRYVACTPRQRVVTFTVRDKKDLRLWTKVQKETGCTFESA